MEATIQGFGSRLGGLGFKTWIWDSLFRDWVFGL